LGYLALAMTKRRNPDQGDPDLSAAQARPPGQDDTVDPAGAAGAHDEPGAGPEEGAIAPAQAEEDELALEVEVEPPPPSPEERIAELEAKLRESHDKYLRSVAETDNVRKRARRDVEDGRADAQGRVLREMLPVIDNLERAVAHADDSGNGASGILEGIMLVLRQFTQALERCNVHPVEAHGRPFDPTEHEAVSQAETDQAAPGSVVEVLQTGYKIGERLLRPALVVVARAPVEQPAGPNGRGAGDADADAGGAGPAGSGGAEE
jgi:molecular chaperone GrpE